MMDVSICNLPVTGGRLQQYQKAQESDPVCAQVRRYCMEGWPDEKKKISSELSQYWKARSHLVVCQDGLLLFGSRIVVPNLFNGKPSTESTMATRVCNDADSEQRYLCGGQGFPVKSRTQSKIARFVAEIFFLEENE